MTAQAVVFGIRFDLLEAADVRGWLAARDADSNFAYVVTPNVDHIVRLERAGPELHRIYSQAELCLCDSQILRRIARPLGVELTLVPGSDLVAILFADVLQAGDRVCLIGGRDAHRASLARLYPDIDIIQHIAPMGLQTDPAARAAAVECAAQAQARIILLAVGSPQQELLAAEMSRRATLKGTALCIGASVDFIIGEKRRAPALLRDAGLEWAWRLALEPRRLAHRYLVEGPKIFMIAWRWWRAEQKKRMVKHVR